MIALAPLLASRTARITLMVIGGVLILVVAWFGIRAYGNAKYDSGVRDTKEEAQRIAALQYQADVTRLTQLAAGLQAVVLELRNAEPEIQTKYITVRDKAPLPTTCRVDAGRMRVINGAIRASNAAGVSRSTVPTGATTTE